MLALDVDTVQLFLALPLLPALDVLPQGLCLQNDLRVLEQRTDEGPHQGIETVGADTTGGATLSAPHGYGVLAGTAIILVFRTLYRGFCLLRTEYGFCGLPAPLSGLRDGCNGHGFAPIGSEPC